MVANMDPNTLVVIIGFTKKIIVIDDCGPDRLEQALRMLADAAHEHVALREAAEYAGLSVAEALTELADDCLSGADAHLEADYEDRSAIADAEYDLHNELYGDE